MEYGMRLPIVGSEKRRVPAIPGIPAVPGVVPGMAGVPGVPKLDLSKARNVSCLKIKKKL